MEKGTYKVKISGVIFTDDAAIYVYLPKPIDKIHVDRPAIFHASFFPTNLAVVLGCITIYNINGFVITIGKEYNYMFKRYVTAQ